MAFIVQLHDQHVHKSQESERVTIAMKGEGGASEPQQLEAEEGSGSWGWSSFKSLLPQSVAASSPDKTLTSPLLQQGAHDRPPQIGTQVCVACACVCVSMAHFVLLSQLSELPPLEEVRPASLATSTAESAAVCAYTHKHTME